LKEGINIQREKIQQGNPKIALVKPCRIDQGVTRLSPQEITMSIRQFDLIKSTKSICFFIPASGSGSRMFGFFFDYLTNPNPAHETITAVENLVQGIQDLTFYQLMPPEWKTQIDAGELNVRQMLETILYSKPFEFATKAKGLIPFHSVGNRLYTPVEEHLNAGFEICGDNPNFHFTISSESTEDFRQCIENWSDQEKRPVHFVLSVQHPDTDSIAFGENMAPIKSESGDNVMRPSGHGALLDNLNSISADLIFIRNIDNIQHPSKREPSTRYRKSLAGELLTLQSAVFELLAAIDRGEEVHETSKALNQRFDLGIRIETLANTERLHEYLNRPIRVCGVVRNEGQPGGGPFWVLDKDGNLSRQIIEKAQISNDPSQLDHLMNATHFNPVDIVCAVKNYKGEKFDLKQFRNPDLYFIVHKTQEGRDIRYVEQPGLWNGGMEMWITLFYEIDNDCFSPVKSVLDLLMPLHQK